MLVVISPAKSLDYDTPVRIRKFTQPDFLDDSTALIDTLRELSPAQVSSLMSISPALGTLNHDRFQQWQRPFSKDNARQALFAFKGDVYIGLDAYALSSDDVAFAQKHLRILSGLYGLLRPLDLIQPYRLEMGTGLTNVRGKSLYDFWGSRITQALNQSLSREKRPVLVNLASNEYFKSVRPRELNARVISPVFKDYSNGQYKIVSFFAKKARGLMSAYIIQNRLKNPDRLLDFDSEGYRYSAEHSRPDAPVFLRKSA